MGETVPLKIPSGNKVYYMLCPTLPSPVFWSFPRCSAGHSQRDLLALLLAQTGVTGVGGGVGRGAISPSVVFGDGTLGDCFT